MQKLEKSSNSTRIPPMCGIRNFLNVFCPKLPPTKTRDKKNELCLISLPDADWLLGRYVDVVGGGGGQALGDQVAGLLKTCGNFRHF